MALIWHHFPTVPDRAARVRTFLQTYGGLPSFDVAEAIATRMEATVVIELSLAQAGVEPQRTWVAEGNQEWAAGEARWVREHASLPRPWFEHGVPIGRQGPGRLPVRDSSHVRRLKAAV